MEETRNKWTLSKEKIEWDAVETIPILLYTDNFTLLSVYKRGIKSNALYLKNNTLLGNFMWIKSLFPVKSSNFAANTTNN